MEMGGDIFKNLQLGAPLLFGAKNQLLILVEGGSINGNGW